MKKFEGLPNSVDHYTGQPVESKGHNWHPRQLAARKEAGLPCPGDDDEVEVPVPTTPKPESDGPMPMKTDAGPAEGAAVAQTAPPVEAPSENLSAK